MYSIYERSAGKEKLSLLPTVLCSVFICAQKILSSTSSSYPSEKCEVQTFALEIVVAPAEVVSTDCIFKLASTAEKIRIPPAPIVPYYQKLKIKLSCIFCICNCFDAMRLNKSVSTSKIVKQVKNVDEDGKNADNVQYHCHL